MKHKLRTKAKLKRPAGTKPDLTFGNALVEAVCFMLNRIRPMAHQMQESSWVGALQSHTHS